MLQKLEDIRDHFYRYVEARTDLFKIEVQSNLEKTIVNAIYFFVFGTLMAMASVVLLLLFAVLLNHLLKSTYLGFLVVFVILVLKSIVWYGYREKIQKWIKKLLHTQIKK
jgi:Putative Actinobacterial Holin-X, holin superfamily III